MIQKFLYFSFPLLLTGCIGSAFFGQTEYLSEEYPDIRTVPSRAEALAPRGIHEGEETAIRDIDKKKLAENLQKIKARNQAIREKVFPAKP